MPVNIHSLFIFLALLYLPPAGAEEVEDDEQDVQEYEPHESEVSQRQLVFYRNPEERREAGLGTQLTQWLSVAGLLEIEDERQQTHFTDEYSLTTTASTITTLQVAFEMVFEPQIEIELVLEGEKSNHTSAKVDEAKLSWERDNYNLIVGRHNLPFGEYFSHFVTGPALEFGETRGSTLELDYAVNAQLEIGIFGFSSEVNPGSNAHRVDWGLVMELSSDDESMRFGASYLSDLAESDEDFLDDYANKSTRDVAAWSAYLLLGFDRFEITAEYLTAIGYFTELEEELNKPSAFNLEFVYFPRENLQLAWRLEGSRELEDQAYKTWGVAIAWRPLPRLNLAMDYLRGIYKSNLIQEDEEPRLLNSHTIGLQLSIEF